MSLYEIGVGFGIVVVVGLLFAILLVACSLRASPAPSAAHPPAKVDNHNSTPL
jgi:hypothetical protein